jgi:hypothetical protein
MVAVVVRLVQCCCGWFLETYASKVSPHGPHGQGQGDPFTSSVCKALINSYMMELLEREIHCRLACLINGREDAETYAMLIFAIERL